MHKGIAYHLKDYCKLIETTGRCIGEDKTGYINSSHSLILARLRSDQWLTLTIEFEKQFCYAAGAEQMMQAFKTHIKHKRLRGMGTARASLKGLSNLIYPLYTPRSDAAHLSMSTHFKKHPLHPI
jgi:hypothetical protein